VREWNNESERENGRERERGLRGRERECNEKEQSLERGWRERWDWH
jgi:hypothetical protein